MLYTIAYSYCLQHHVDSCGKEKQLKFDHLLLQQSPGFLSGCVSFFVICFDFSKEFIFIEIFSPFSSCRIYNIMWVNVLVINANQLSNIYLYLDIAHLWHI